MAMATNRKRPTEPIWSPTKILRLTLVLSLSLALAMGRSLKDDYSKIPALGHNSRLGDLYDVRTAQFINRNIFKSTHFPTNILITTEEQRIKMESNIVENHADKFALLDIDPNTAVNILSGLVEPKDQSFSVLNDMRRGRDEVAALFMYKHTTFIQELDLYAYNLKRIYREGSLRRETGATHLITGITWGVNIAIFLTGNSRKYKNTDQILTEMESELSVLKLSPANHSGRDSDTQSNFSILVQSGILFPLHRLTTHHQVHQLWRQVPHLLQQHEGGKGAPIFYHLTPLQTLQSYLELELETEFNYLSQTIPGFTLRKFYQVFDEMSDAEQTLNNLKRTLGSNTKCITLETRVNLNTLREDFYDFKDTLKRDLRDSLIHARSRSPSISSLNNSNELANLENRFGRNKFSGANFQQRLEQFDYALRKVERCNFIQDNYQEIDYFAAENRLYSKMLLNINRTVYILLLKQHGKGGDADLEERSQTQNQLSTFLNDLYSAKNESILFVVDCDFKFLICSSLYETGIVEFFKGKLRRSDFVDSLNYRDNGLGLQMQIRRILETGRDELLDDTCDSRSSCQNGGSCLYGFNSFVCHCPQNYTGQYCERDVNECLRQPTICQNGGTCQNSNGSYNCACSRGWIGPHCENFDNCFNSSCLNGGKCHDREDGFFCECPFGFEGLTCSEPTPSIQCPDSMGGSKMFISRSRSALLTLNSSGLIPLPPQGSSVQLKYKSNETYSNNERSLWTLDGTVNGSRYLTMTLKVSLLCDGFGNTRDVLSLHANRQNEYNYNATFSSHLLQKGRPFEGTGSGFYLSFTSDRATTGYGFVVEIEVIALDAGNENNIGENYFYLTSPGNFTHGPYSAYEQFSIGISPSAATTLTVNYVDTEICNGCNCDALSLFEVRENGVLFENGRLCGRNHSLPLIFTTADPILAVFISDNSNQGRGFHISWI